MSGNAVVTDRKITREDIEAKLRDLQGDISERTEAAKVPAIAIAVGVAVVTIAAAYFFGRRKGKRRQTVLEIRRI
jgi:predicted xylose isomerase-like sugar epimerase